MFYFVKIIILFYIFKFLYIIFTIKEIIEKNILDYYYKKLIFLCFIFDLKYLNIKLIILKIITNYIKYLIKYLIIFKLNINIIT